MGADMPSMPMAHNVKPVKAQAGEDARRVPRAARPRDAGEWAVKLRLAGPVRDQLVLHYEFDERGARRSNEARKSPRK